MSLISKDILVLHFLFNEKNESKEMHKRRMKLNVISRGGQDSSNRSDKIDKKN
jgi:hypothetical protein